jgi:SET domain-containing protein
MMNPADHPLVAFKTSAIHGTGGFARVSLRKGQRLIEYIGPRLSKADMQVELDAGNAYVFILEEDDAIDGSVAWNPARFLNHSCDPNCESRMVRGRIWFYALRAIRAGEELTYDYGHGLGGYRDRPCHCGSATCVGFRVAAKHVATLRKRWYSACGRTRGRR